MTSQVKGAAIENVIKTLNERYQLTIVKIINILVEHTLVLNISPGDKKCLENYICTGSVEYLETSGFKHIVNFVECKTVNNRALICAQYMYGYDNTGIQWLIEARRQRLSGVSVAQKFLDKCNNIYRHMYQSAEAIATIVLKQNNILTNTAVVKALQQSILPIPKSMLNIINYQKNADKQFLMQIPLLAHCDDKKTIKVIMDEVKVIQNTYIDYLISHLINLRMRLAYQQHDNFVVQIGDNSAARLQSKQYTVIAKSKTTATYKSIEDIHQKLKNITDRTRAALDNRADLNEDDRFIWTVIMNSLLRNVRNRQNMILDETRDISMQLYKAEEARKQ